METKLVECVERIQDLVHGQTYRVTSQNYMEDMYKVYTENGVYLGIYCSKRFRPIVEKLCTDYKQLYSDALNLIGTWVEIQTEGVVVTRKVMFATLLLDERQLVYDYDTPDIRERFNNKQYCIVLTTESESRRRANHPLELCRPAAIHKSLVLNEQYTAEVYADKIKVGCQEFPIKTLYDLVALHKEIE
jgi:hypothetical protein